MSFDAHANFGYTTVTAAPSPAASGTSLTVADASVFPAAPFNATVWAAGEIPLASNAEIVRVTDVIGNVLTIVRAQELTSARSILVGDQIANTITAKVLTDVEAAIPSTVGLLSAVNVSAGLASQNLSALTFSNSNGVSFGLTNGVVTATVATNYQPPGAYLTTAALSQDSSKYAGTNGAITGGSITVNTSGVSINLPGYLTTAMQSNAVTLSNAKFSGGTLSALRSDLAFGDSNGISFGLNTNGVLTGTVATNYQSAGAYLTTAMRSDAVTLSNIKVSAGTLSAARSDLTFSNSNGISFGLETNGVVTATVATNYQSQGAYLTTAALSQDSSKYAGTNGAITGGSITVNTSGVSVNLPAYLSTQSTQYLAVTLGGNTAGTTTFQASDNATLFLHGGNNITLSGNGASITISGPAAAGAQTGISGIVVSDTTYTSGTVSFSNLGNITISSSVNGATQYIGLSGNPAQTAQTQSNIQAVYDGANSISTGTIRFTNANGVSFSVNGQTVSASVAAQSNQSVGLYASSNTYLTSSGTVDARSLSFRGDKSITVGISSGEVVFSVGAYLTTAMLSNAVTLSNIKVSAGANSALLSAFTLSDSNGLAFGLNGSTITGSYTVPVVTNSSMSVSDAATSGTLARLAFTNLNGVTLSLSTGAGGSHTIVGSHNAITSQSTQFIALTLGGNTAGTSTFHATNNASLFLNGGNNITLSGNGSTVTISAAAQTNQSAIKGFGVSNTGQTAGNTGLSTGIDWVLAGSDSITLSQSTAVGGPNTVWFKHPAWLTTAMASNRGSDFVQATAGFNGTNASGTMASNSWSVSVAAPIPIATAVKAVSSVGSTGTITRYAPEDHQHAGVAAFAVTNTGNTLGNTRSQVGTLYIAATGAITASQSTAAAGNDTVWLSVAAQSNQSAIKGFGVSNTGNTAGNTGLSTGIDWVLAASNSLTLSQSTAGGGPNTVWVQVGAYLTTAMRSDRGSDFVQATAGFNGTNASGTIASNAISVSVLSQSNQTMSWYASGNTTGQSSNTSFDARTISISAVGNLSVGYSGSMLLISGGSAAPSPVNFSAGTTSGNLGSVVFSNSNGVSFGLNGSTITGTVSTYDTVGTATTVKAVASANSVGTVTRWAAEDHAHAGIGAFGISTAGNTSGTTGSVQGTYWFQGGNNLTVSQITSNNGSHTLVLSGQPEGYNGWLEPYPLNTATATVLPVAGSWYLAPFTAYGSVSGGRVNFLAVNTGTANLFQDIGETAYKSNITGTLSQVFTLSAAMAIFSQGTGTNSTRLESVWSNSHSFGWSKVLNVSTNAATNFAVSLAHSISYQSEIGSNGAYTNVQYANAGSSTSNNSSAASTALSTVFSSGRNLISGSLVQPFGFSTTLTAGVYWMGYAWSSTRGTTTTGGQLGSAPDFGFSALLGMSRLAVDSLYRNFGSTVTTARSQLIPSGVYTGGANMAPPSAIALSSDLSSLASQWVPYFAFNNRGLTK